MNVSKQPNLLDDSVKEIRPKRRARNSSFNARCFIQFKRLVKVLEDVADDKDDLSSIQLELDKSKMLLKEKSKT